MARLSFTIDEVPIGTIIALLLAIEETSDDGLTVTTSDYNGELTNMVVSLPGTETPAFDAARTATLTERLIDAEAKALAMSTVLKEAQAKTEWLEKALEESRAQVRFSTEGRQWAALSEAQTRIADLEQALATEHALAVDLEQAVGRALAVAPDSEPEDAPEQEVYTCPEGCTYDDLLDESMTWLTVAARDAHIVEQHPHLVVSWSEGDTSEPAAERREIPKDELYRLRLEEEEPWREAEPPATEDEVTSEPAEPEPKPDPNEQVDSDGRSAAGDYPCLLCAAEGRDTRFMTRNGLVGHRHSVKVDERLPFVCSCGKRSKTEGLWRNHRHAVASPMQHYLLGRPEDGDGEKGDDVAAEEAMAGG